MWLNTLELQSSGSCGCWVSLQATQPQSPWLWECHLWAILSLVFGPEKFHVEKQEKRKDIHSSCGHKKLLSHNFEIDLYMRTSLQCASALRMLVLAFQAITSYNVNGSYDAIGLSGFDGKWWSKIAYILIRFIECIWFFNLFGLEVGQVLRAAGCSLMMYYMSCTRNAMRSALQPCLAYWRSLGVCLQLTNSVKRNTDFNTACHYHLTSLSNLFILIILLWPEISQSLERSRAVDLLELAVHGDLKLLETPLERSLERGKRITRIPFVQTHCSWDPAFIWIIAFRCF